MKTCTQCKIDKSLSEFNKNKARKDGHANVCRECMKLLRKDHYLRNKDAVLSAVIARRQTIADEVWKYKNNHPCVDCGESDPRVLEFDHLPEFEKEFNISKAVLEGYGLERIMAEIEKCEVVCANHHRIRTHVRGGWVRNINVLA